MPRLPDRFDLFVRKARESIDPERQADLILGALAGLKEWHFLDLGAPGKPNAAKTDIEDEPYLLVFTDPAHLEDAMPVGSPRPSLITIPPRPRWRGASSAAWGVFGQSARRLGPHPLRAAGGLPPRVESPGCAPVHRVLDSQHDLRGRGFLAGAWLLAGQAPPEAPLLVAQINFTGLTRRAGKHNVLQHGWTPSPLFCPADLFGLHWAGPFSSLSQKLDLARHLLTIKPELDQIEERLRFQVQEFDPGISGYVGYALDGNGKRIARRWRCWPRARAANRRRSISTSPSIVELIHLARWCTTTSWTAQPSAAASRPPSPSGARRFLCCSAIAFSATR